MVSDHLYHFVELSAKIDNRLYSARVYDFTLLLSLCLRIKVRQKVKRYQNRTKEIRNVADREETRADKPKIGEVQVNGYDFPEEVFKSMEQSDGEENHLFVAKYRVT